MTKPSGYETVQLALLTAMGLGYLRPAPGTWGSLPPVGLVLLVICLLDSRSPHGANLIIINGALIVLGGIFSFACLRFGGSAEVRFGGKDPSNVVADEVAGQSVALLLLPWRSLDQPDAWKWNLALTATAFLAFRAMDIIKPPPARQMERLPAGAGILVDDLIAGVYALILTQIAARLILPAL